MELRVLGTIVEGTRVTGRRMYLDREYDQSVMLSLVRLLRRFEGQWVMVDQSFVFPLGGPCAAKVVESILAEIWGKMNRSIHDRRWGGTWWRQSGQRVMKELGYHLPPMHSSRVLVAQAWDEVMPVLLQKKFPTAQVHAWVGSAFAPESDCREMAGVIRGGLWEGDFLELTSAKVHQVAGGFDVIVVLPPFYPGYTWARWVCHAVDLMDEGGIVVALMPGNINWPGAPIANHVRDLLDEHGELYRTAKVHVNNSNNRVEVALGRIEVP